MALKVAFVSPQGIAADEAYVKITNIRIDNISKKTGFDVVLYASEGARRECLAHKRRALNEALQLAKAKMVGLREERLQGKVEESHVLEAELLVGTLEKQLDDVVGVKPLYSTWLEFDEVPTGEDALIWAYKRLGRVVLDGRHDGEKVHCDFTQAETVYA